MNLGYSGTEEFKGKSYTCENPNSILNRCDKCGRSGLTQVFNIGGVNYCTECYYRAFSVTMTYAPVWTFCPHCGKPIK